MNGLLAQMGSPHYKSLIDAEQTKVCCFQEVKATPSQVTAIMMEHFHGWSYLLDPGSGGHGGTLTAWADSAVVLLGSSTGLGEGILFGGEGRVVTTSFGVPGRSESSASVFTVVNAYVPNSGQNRSTNPFTKSRGVQGAKLILIATLRS